MVGAPFTPSLGLYLGAGCSGPEIVEAAVPYSFVPPQSTQVNMLEGSLRVTFQVSQTVWKDENGVWRSAECPSADTLALATKLLAVSGRPQVVDDATAAELIAAGIGTLTLIV